MAFGPEGAEPPIMRVYYVDPNIGAHGPAKLCNVRTGVPLTLRWRCPKFYSLWRKGSAIWAGSPDQESIARLVNWVSRFPQS